MSVFAVSMSNEYDCQLQCSISNSHSDSDEDVTMLGIALANPCTTSTNKTFALAISVPWSHISSASSSKAVTSESVQVFSNEIRKSFSFTFNTEQYEQRTDSSLSPFSKLKLEQKIPNNLLSTHVMLYISNCTVVWVSFKIKVV